MSSDYDNASNLKSELVGALKSVDLDGFNFAVEETDSQAVATFTNSKVNEIIKLDAIDKLALRYTLVKDLRVGTQSVSKTEVTKSAERVVVLTTDMETGDTLERFAFPEATSHDHSETFETLTECIDNARCKQAELQCEANRTCEDQFYHLHCCLTNGACYSVLLFFRPTSLRCRINPRLPNFEGVLEVANEDN